MRSSACRLRLAVVQRAWASACCCFSSAFSCRCQPLLQSTVYLLQTLSPLLILQTAFTRAAGCWQETQLRHLLNAHVLEAEGSRSQGQVLTSVSRSICAWISLIRCCWVLLSALPFCSSSAGAALSCPDALPASRPGEPPNLSTRLCRTGDAAASLSAACPCWPQIATVQFLSNILSKRRMGLCRRIVGKVARSGGQKDVGRKMLRGGVYRCFVLPQAFKEAPALALQGCLVSLQLCPLSLPCTLLLHRA